MRYTRAIFNTLLLLTIPATSLYVPTQASTITIPDTKPFIEIRELQEWSLNDPLLSYDDIINFIEKLETSELDDKYSAEELEKITNFLITLARAGVLPDGADEELILENDIEELLHGEDNPYEYSFSFSPDTGEYLIIPAVSTGRDEVIHCGWIKKACKKVKKFIKEHKAEIILGVVVVVAVVAVVVTAGAAAPAAAASAAGAAAASSGTDSKDKNNSEAKHEEGVPSTILPDAKDSPNLKAVLEEQIISFKENISKERFLQPSPYGESTLGEDGKILGSLFAHDSFNKLTRQFSDHPQLAEELQNIGLQNHFPTPEGNSGTSLDFGHQEIDRKFSTDYATLYGNPSKEADFNTLSYQKRGERALSSGYLNQAVHDLGKAIELDPITPLPYLERGVAHFGLGQYDRSIEDYHQFTSQTQKNHSLSMPDFSLGFAKGLPQGIYDSGAGLFLFLSDLIRHPVNTGGQMWDALTLLSNLARSEQWIALSEVLAPEVHQLVKEWDTLPSDVRGELAGYAFGKYGSDIIIPGALAKAVSKGLKGAQELNAVYKGLQNAEKTLLLESVAGLENGAKIGEVIETSHRTIFLADELGFPAHEMAQLKKAGNLESAVANTVENIANNPSLSKSLELFKRAEAFLEPYSKGFIPEIQAKELIHQTGIRTFPRPEGIPENYRVRVTNRGAGIEYMHPNNTHISTRVMPGKPHSPYPSQQKPYVIQKKDGKAFDKYGNLVDQGAPEAHIPIDEFIYRNN